MGARRDARSPLTTAGPEPDEWQLLAQRSLRAARRVLRGPDAEDASQEALLRAWRHRETLRDSERGGAWVATIAHNAALHLHQRERGVAAGRDPDSAALERAEADERGYDEVMDELVFDRLLEPFSERDRAMLRMRFVDDLPFDEIAQRLDMPVATTKVRLHRLRPRLQTILKERRSLP